MKTYVRILVVILIGFVSCHTKMTIEDEKESNDLATALVATYYKNYKAKDYQANSVIYNNFDDHGMSDSTFIAFSAKIQGKAGNFVQYTIREIHSKITTEDGKKSGWVTVETVAAYEKFDVAEVFTFQYHLDEFALTNLVLHQDLLLSDSL